MKTPVTYRDAGVDIDAGNALVERIKPLARATRRIGCIDDLGGFGALFDLKATGFRDPVLVSSTDGVGTKLIIAQQADRHAHIGIDLVAMCVNDLIVQGAQPLFFLDYFATGGLDVETAASVIEGIANGCKQAGCALIGGETAEMPGLYAPGEYDLAGFTVGAVERDQLLPRQIAAGDVVLGLAASGVHSNGFSLVRRVMQHANLTVHSPAPFASGQTMADMLLVPTKIYVNACLSALKHDPHAVHGFAHITGGGLPENLPRILPPHLAANLSARAWPLPPIFQWLQQECAIPPADFWRTFNAGIGMVAVVAADAADALTAHFTQCGETVYRLGHITTRETHAVIIHD